MPLSDALTITFLGLAVVFSGLLLTALLIMMFGFLNRSGDAPGGEAAHENRGGQSAIQPTPEDPAVVAIITTVLEVERRLHRAESGGRLTISRSS